MKTIMLFEKRIAELERDEMIHPSTKAALIRENKKLIVYFQGLSLSPPQEEKREITDAIEFAEWINDRYSCNEASDWWKDSRQYSTEELYQSFIKQKGEV